MKSFLDSVYVISHSNHTLLTYRTALWKFQTFLQERYNTDESGLVQQVKDERINIYALLREFVVYQDKIGNTAKTIKSHMSGVNGYLRYLGVKINSDEYKHLVKTPRVRRMHEKPITKDMIVRLLHNSPPKLQAAIVMAVSSGMRLGEMVQLKLSDIDFAVTPTKIRLRAATTKTRETRETFLTAEATQILKDYLAGSFGWNENDKNAHLQNTLIFAKTKQRGKKDPIKENETIYAEFSLQHSLQTHVKRIPDLDGKNENGRNTVHFHGFRKYFRTTVGNVCGRDFAEALIGHGFYMDTYYVLSEDQKKELYLKAEPYLTISDFKAVEDNMRTLTEDYKKLEKKFDNFVQYFEENGIKVPEMLLKN
ncbi:MAG: hypothetical protein EB149_07080 [Thaumarchaeota archaeon]|nr:hypothetical protein [Nitrososphaerota archaeon]